MGTTSEPAVAAIDCGTTRIKAAVFDGNGRVHSFASGASPALPTSDGGVEVDPAALIGQAFACLREAVQNSRRKDLRPQAIAITNQRATVTCLGKDGRPLGRTISWLDLRGAELLAGFARQMGETAFRRITGLPLHPVFTLAKLLWLQRERTSVWRRTARVALVHDLLLHALGCKDVCCDESNASLAGLLALGSRRWSPKILAAARIPETRLPSLVPSGTVVGQLSSRAARRCGLPQGTPLVAGGGDQQCAGIGAGAVQPGIIEITLGTAAVALSCTCHPARVGRGNLMRCVHAVPGRWEVEGLQNTAGASLEWLSGLGGRRRFFPRRFWDEVARVPVGANGVLFYPYLAGAAVPHWEPQARGVFTGLALSHDRRTLARAILEGVTFETREILEAFADCGVPVREVRLTGGCAEIVTWRQIIADVLNRPVSVLNTPSASLLGAAVLAAVGIDAFSSVEQGAAQMVHIRWHHRSEPETAARYARCYERYCATRVNLKRSGVFQNSPTPQEEAHG